MTLRTHMEAALAEWPAGVPEAWRDVLAGAVPDFGAIPMDLAHDGARQPAYPPLQADNGQHLFRAFCETTPAAVRVVVIGQDPYPDRRRATGRAFEDGGAAHHLGVANSLKRLLQSALETAPAPQGDRNDDGLIRLEAQIREHLPDQTAMTHYFNGLERQGVLFLNAAWTFTDSEHRGAHRALWQPVTLRLIENLAARDQPTVFVFFGRHAQCLLSRIEGIWRHAAIVRNEHPSIPAYFQSPNPIVRATTSLGTLRQPIDPPAAPIQWWPPFPADAE